MVNRKPLCIAAAVALVTTAAAGQVPAISESAVVGPSTEAVTRVITLKERGFPDGFEIAGLSGSREIYFPIPADAGAQNLRLVLPYRTDSSFNSRRALSIEVGGKTLYTTALPDGFSEGVIDVPINASLIEQGFLAARIVYSGAITEDRCVDQRLSAAYLSFAGSGGLRAQLDGASLTRVASLAAAMPTAIDVDLPAGASAAQTAAALTLMLGGVDARLAGNRRTNPAFGEGWQVSRVIFSDPASPALSVQREAGEPVLQIGGEDPVASARLLRSRWNALVASPAAGSAQRNAGAAATTLTVGDLGGDTSIQNVVDRGQWNVAIPTAAVPAGQRMTGMVVDVAAAEDGGTTRPVIAVLLNGVLLASAEAEDDGRTRLDVDFPQGLTTSRNNLEVSVARQPAGGDCKFAPQGYPAQLLPSSHVKLYPVGTVADFSDLPTVLNGGFTLVMPGADALGPVASLLGALANGEGAVTVSYSDMPEAGAVVYVGDQAPAGTDPIVRFDQGAVTIDGENGQTLLDAEAIGELTTVQLLEQGGRTVVWIKPGADFAALATSASPPVLSYGNVAFLAGDQLDFAFHNARERLIDIRYPEENTFSQFLSRYRLWLIGLGWLLVTLGFVYLLRRVIVANKTKD